MKEMLEGLRARHQFDLRQGRNRAGTSLFVWRFFLAGNEIAGWRAHRIRTAQTPEGPAGTLSVWQREGGDKDDLIGLDVYEAESRAAAHEFVLRLLGEFQGDPGDQTSVLGDVSFVTGSSALFARANLVVLARPLGPGLSAVGIAQEFDRGLMTEPKPDGSSAPAIEVFRARGSALEIVAEDPRKRPIQYRLFAPSGEFGAAAGALRFVHGDDKPVRVTLYAINSDGEARRAELEVPTVRG